MNVSRTHEWLTGQFAVCVEAKVPQQARFRLAACVVVASWAGTAVPVVVAAVDTVVAEVAVVVVAEVAMAAVSVVVVVVGLVTIGPCNGQRDILQLHA